MNIKCPLCQTQMELRKGKCKYGTNVEIYQCPQCGGIWGNEWEFYRIDPDQAATFVDIDEENFEKKISSHEELSCPKCSSSLEIVRDPFILDDIDFEICIDCKGVWMKAGTFLDYKQWRRKKIISKDKEKEFQELKNQIQDLLIIQNHKERSKTETIGKIGQFLGKRVGPGGINLWFRRAEWKEHEKNWFAIIVVIIIISSAIFARIVARILG